VSGGIELPLLYAVVLIAALLETALQFASLAKLEDELEDRTARERYAQYLTAGRAVDTLCMTARIVGSAAVIACVALTQSGPWPMVGAAALLVLTELAGRGIGRRWSTGTLLLFLPACYRLAWPLRLGAERTPEPDAEPEPEVVDAAREEIRVAIEDGVDEGALDEDEREMIEGILKFGDVDVAEIMTPRTEMECIDAETSIAVAATRLAASNHSRIPVFEDTVDKIVGIVYARDILAVVTADTPTPDALRSIAREPYFIPETKTVDTLLDDFQREHLQIAVVLDEYGGVAGLVTVEDIMEEIVGEIQDEYDQEDHESRILLLADGAVEVDGRVRIDELNEQFDLGIPEDDDYDTVGGLATTLFDRVPAAGDHTKMGERTLTVLESNERRVVRVRIE